MVNCRRFLLMLPRSPAIFPEGARRTPFVFLPIAKFTSTSWSENIPRPTLVFQKLSISCTRNRFRACVRAVIVRTTNWKVMNCAALGARNTPLGVYRPRNLVEHKRDVIYLLPNKKARRRGDFMGATNRSSASIFIIYS